MAILEATVGVVVDFVAVVVVNVVIVVSVIVVGLFVATDHIIFSLGQ